MRSLGPRRALATGVAAATAFALAGCSAGQVAETAIKRPSNAGVNAETSDRQILVRNLTVQYPGLEGYEAGEDAPLELGLYNRSNAPVTVLISSRPPAEGSDEGVVSARQVGLAGGSSRPAGGSSAAASAPASARPSASQDPDGVNEQEVIPDPEAGGSASASAPARRPSASASAPSAEAEIEPARIELAPQGSAVFLPGDAQEVRAIGLSGELLPSASINLVFEFSNGAEPLTLQAPVSTPLAPASRVPGAEDEMHE